MNLALIAPIKMLDKYCITSTQYCLPDLIITSKEYRDFYSQKKKQGNKIVLDCRKAGWKRSPCPLENLLDTIEWLSPSCIILPSEMFSSKKTIESTEATLGALSSEKINLNGTELLGCLEGTGLEDIQECRDSYSKHGLKIALPAHMYTYLEELKGIDLFIENRLRIEELTPTQGSIICTSLPIRLGLQGRLLPNFSPTPQSLTMNEEEDNYPEVVIRNIQEAIEYYEGN